MGNDCAGAAFRVASSHSNKYEAHVAVLFGYFNGTTTPCLNHIQSIRGETFTCMVRW